MIWTKIFRCHWNDQFVPYAIMYCKFRSQTFWTNQIADSNVLSRTAASTRLLWNSMECSAEAPHKLYIAKPNNKPCRYDNTYTVCMKSLTIISVQLHLLHLFKSDFAHLLASVNLVIELINAKKRAKNI